MKAGQRIQALAFKMKGEEWAKAKYPNTWKTHLIFGDLLERAGQRSWRIKWDGIDAPTGHGSRHLRPHGTPLNEHFQKKRKEKS